MDKQKIIDYIEELERKAQDGERYFKLWHKEYHKNKQAIEYIEENRTIVDERNGDLLYWLNDDFDEQKIINILKGEDNE